MPDAADLVRVTLDPAVRARRQRQHSAPGVAQVGGTYFLDGVAYVPRGSTLVQRLESGSWLGAVVSEHANPELVAEHEARLDAILHPPPGPPVRCHPARGIGTPFYEPAYCHGGHRHGDGCRELYPGKLPAAA